MPREVLLYFRSPKTGSSALVETIDESHYNTFRLMRINTEEFRSKKNLDIITVNAAPPGKVYVRHGQKSSNGGPPCGDHFEDYDKILEALEEKKQKEDLVYIRVGIVREPYDKFMSSINYIFKKDKKKYTALMMENPWPSSKGNNSPLNMTKYQHILRTQTNSLSYKGDFLVDYLIRFEEPSNLGDNVSKFFSSYGYNIKMKHTNKTKNKSLHMTREYAQFVNDNFQEDFKNFNYPRLSNRVINLLDPN